MCVCERHKINIKVVQVLKIGVLPEDQHSFCDDADEIKLMFTTKTCVI